MIDKNMNSEAIENDAILKQLQKILLSPKFVASKRLSRFLSYIVEETCSDRFENIKAYNIALEVFDRESNFDPQSDPIVRIYAGRLRQAIKEYYAFEGKNDAVYIEVPKGAYRPQFSVNTLKDDELLAANKGVRSKRNLISRPLFYVIILAIFGLVFVSYSIFNSLNSNDLSDVYGRASIKINPIQNLSLSIENDQFSLSLIEQTEIALGQFSSILIEDSYDKNKPKANYTMSGSVQKEKDIVILRIKLIDNITGIQVFSKEYKESLDTEAAIYIEASFANKIAIDLADEFGELQKFRLRNAQNNDSELLPHEAVMHYYNYLTFMNKEDNGKILLELNKAVENYENYAPAWAAISGLYNDRYKHFGGDLNDLELAKSAIEKAENINPRSVNVQNHLALIAYNYGNLDDFYDAIDKQMSLNPNATILGQSGLWLCLIGDHKRGIPLIEEAKKRNPYYPRFFHFGNAVFYLENGDFESAYLESEKVRMPNLFWDPLFRAGILGKLGRINEAKEALNELLELKPEFPSNGPELMRRALYSEKYRKILLEGLQNAGLELH